MSKKNNALMNAGIETIKKRNEGKRSLEELLKKVISISPEIRNIARGITDFYINKIGLENALENFELVKAQIIEELKITEIGKYIKDKGKIVSEIKDVIILEEYDSAGVNKDAETLYSYGISSLDSEGNLNLGCWFDDSYIGEFYIEVVNGEEYHYMVLTK